MANLTALKGNNDTDWWRGAVIYQIYPRSFQDSNGDGIGDLPGITSRLPYLTKLGIDAIWISPFFTSPMKDFGYDVSDYRDIDPLFGTLDDFEQLIKTAHGLGIRIMIDLVLSHSSDQHPWFQESRQSKDNDKSDWYVWADAQPDGTPPNNWLSIFGGSAWTWDTRRCQYYMHNFLASQPDFNFHNPTVQQALLEIVEYWLKKGVDGFRLDTINFYFCDNELRNNPPLDSTLRNDSIAPAVNPYNHQDHLYDKSQPENLVFLESLRKLLNSYPGSTIVGEVGDAQRGMEVLAEYTKGSKRAHMCYAFDFLCPHPPAAEYFAKVLNAFESSAPESWACWAFSNHDVIRHATRWEKTSDPLFLRMLVTLIMCMKGSVCLYQGEELGLTEATLAFEELQDPYGIEFWPEFPGRDGCRTPMAWEADQKNGGFTTGHPWLPVAEEHIKKAVSLQDNEESSLLVFYRKLLAFRKTTALLQNGNIQEIEANNGLLQFTRVKDEEKIHCYFNFSDESKEISYGHNQCVLFSSSRVGTKLEEIQLPPSTALLIQ